MLLDFRPGWLSEYGSLIFRRTPAKSGRTIEWKAASREGAAETAGRPRMLGGADSEARLRNDATRFRVDVTNNIPD